MRKSIYYSMLSILLVSIALFIFSCKKEMDKDDEPIPTIDNFKYPTGGIPPTKEQLARIPAIRNFEELGIDDGFGKTGKEELHSSFEIDCVPYLAGNQGKQNSCIGWAVGYGFASTIHTLRTGVGYIDMGSAMVYWGAGFQTFYSPSFLYNQVNKGEDKGSFMQENIELLINQGICTLEDMPYNEADFRLQPTALQKAKASFNKIIPYDPSNKKGYTRADMSSPSVIDCIKRTLAMNIPVPVGIHIVTRQFYALNGDTYKSIEGIPDQYHAVLLCGYDDHKKAFLFLNSWGREWGYEGLGWIDYDFAKTQIRYKDDLGNIQTGPVMQEAYFIIDKRLLNAKKQPLPIRPSLLHEFTGSTKGTPYEINYLLNFKGKPAIEFKQDKGSRIEYNSNYDIFTDEGTIEMEIYIEKAYQYKKDTLISNVECPIFTNNHANQDDRNVHDKGGTLFVNGISGAIKFIITNPKLKPYQEVSVTSSNFRFNQWHTVGISYGSQGQVIMLDGKEIARVPSNTESLGHFMNHPTLGESVKAVAPGSQVILSKDYRGGFEGYVARFRTSRKQRDWRLE